MIQNALLAAVMSIGLAAPSAVWAEPVCYDAKAQGRPVDQIPSEITDCDNDCLVMSWPWFVDLRVSRVVDGAVPSKMIRVLTVQHTYRVSRKMSWILRKNTAGGYNVLVSDDNSVLNRCSAETSPIAPYIQPSGGRTLDELRDAGIRRYGHHTS